MKVSTQPMSAFAVYSEKLKQKKKKTKPQVSNGINKVNKTQVKKVSKPLKSADKETWQMKEIGYILKKLAERSVDASSHRATDLLNSINEANKNLEHNVNSYFHKSLDRVILVRPNDLKKKSTNLKRKKGSKSNNSLHSNIESSKTLSNKKNHPIKTNNTSSPPPHKSKSAVGKKTDLKLKKDKEALKKGCKVATKSTSTVKSLRGEKNEMKSRHRNNLKKRKGSDQHEIKSDNVKKGKLQQLEASDATAKLLFEWLITPVLEKDFMSDFWEKKPLLIQRESNRSYYSELLSTEMIDTMLRENNVCFTKHLDVTSYTDGVRETHNLSGRAQANVVWDFYSNGCSVRLLNPQIFIPKIHALNATLQEYFGCFVGANVYLTPPNSQGFAPHYDDIEAFVLQIEGKKHWKVYLPRSKEEVLPRFSSPNFLQDEIGEPFLDVVLEPGDLLYFPRGFIHQATTVEGEHSLHITLSAYQKTAWVDLLEKVLPIALRRAVENDADFRAGLPRDYLGLEHRGGAQDKQRFVDTAQSLVRKLGDYVQLSLGAGVDLMGAQFMHDALPPVLTPAEKQSSSAGGGLKLKDGKLNGRVEIQMDTCVKLIRYNVCRLVEEQEGEARLFHCLDNSLEYHGEEPQFLVLPPEGVPVITQLQASYPAFVPVSKLPHEDPEALLVLISDLWDAGLLSAKKLPVVEEN